MKHSKANFGTKQVISVVIATAVYLLLEWLQQYLVMAGVLSSQSYYGFKFRVLVVTIVSALQGPIVGTLVAIGGTLLSNVVFYGYISYTEVVAYAIDAIVLGCFAEKFAVLRGGFRKLKIIDFNVVQGVVNIFCSMMFAPLFLFLTEGINLQVGIGRGTRSAIGNIIGIGLIGTPILMIISKVVGRKHPERIIVSNENDKKVTKEKPLEFDERVRTMYKERL